MEKEAEGGRKERSMWNYRERKVEGGGKKDNANKKYGK